MIFEGTKNQFFFGLELTRAGETQPNTDTLKLLSQEFEVSVNTLLGSPRQLICQCCGMPFCISVKRVFIGLSCGTYAES